MTVIIGSRKVVAAGLLTALSAAASAQSPMPVAPQEAQQPAPPAPPAAPVAASTTTAEVAVSTAGVKVAGGAPKAKLTRPIHATLHAEAKDWEPLSLKPGGDPETAETKAVLKQVKVKGKLKGEASKAKATIRLHKVKDARWLVVSIWPKALERRRLHLEVRFRIVEGFVEDAKALAVSVVDRRYTGAGLDSDELRERGVEFAEESPEKGQILVSALDPRPSKTARNSGTLKLAAFGDKDVGLADASWSVVGLR